jgi:hypothetical protein
MISLGLSLEEEEPTETAEATIAEEPMPAAHSTMEEVD